jgi:hypothetical protein
MACPSSVGDNGTDTQLLRRRKGSGGLIGYHPRGLAQLRALRPLPVVQETLGQARMHRLPLGYSSRSLATPRTIIVSCSLRIILDPPQNNANMARCWARRTPLLLGGGARSARPLCVIGDDASLYLWTAPTFSFF